MKEDTYKQITAWLCLPLLPTQPFGTDDHLFGEQESKAARQKLLVLWYRNRINANGFCGTVNIQVRFTCGSKYRDYSKGTHFHSALSTRPQRNLLSFLLQHSSSFYLYIYIHTLMYILYVWSAGSLEVLPVLYTVYYWRQVIWIESDT